MIISGPGQTASHVLPELLTRGVVLMRSGKPGRRRRARLQHRCLQERRKRNMAKLTGWDIWKIIEFVLEIEN